MPVPDGLKSIAKLAKKAPGDETVEDGKCWMMMDSGAGCNGGKCKKLFQRYEIQPRAHEHPELNCVTACGTKLEHNGYVNLHVDDGGEGHIVPMVGLNVSVPVLSVHKIAKNGNDAKSRLGGGCILDKN